MVLTVQATSIFSSFMDVICFSHPIFYGAKGSSHHVLSFFVGVNCLSHTVFSMVLTVQATSIFSSFMGVNCLNHPIFYGANCSSHHVLSFFAGVNCLSHPVFSMVLTVQAISVFSSFMGVNCFSDPILYGANCSSHLVLRFFAGGC